MNKEICDALIVLSLILGLSIMFAAGRDFGRQSLHYHDIDSDIALCVGRSFGAIGCHPISQQKATCRLFLDEKNSFSAVCNVFEEDWK